MIAWLVTIRWGEGIGPIGYYSKGLYSIHKYEQIYHQRILIIINHINNHCRCIKMGEYYGNSYSHLPFTCPVT